jgi:hypothetical protein
LLLLLLVMMHLLLLRLLFGLHDYVVDQVSAFELLLIQVARSLF